MDLQQFISDFSKEFGDTPESSFNPLTRFKDLEEWDSVLALSIISMIDENYEKRISGNELRNCNTIEDLFNVVNNMNP
jgi:acyl carrier protein